MFSQRKRFYQRKSFYGMVLVALLAFGFWINQDPATEGKGADFQEPLVSAGEPVKKGAEDKGEDPDGDVAALGSNGGVSPDSDEGANTTEAEGPCYLIKEDQGFIKVYFIDEAGGSQLIRTTDISFSLLSESDQLLFQKGLVKQTQEELSELLQDFES